MGWHPFRYRTITIGALPNRTRFYRYTMSKPTLEDTTGPPDKVKFDVDPFNLSIDTAQSNSSNVKELIPEFYDPDCSDFLINAMGLHSAISNRRANASSTSPNN